MPTQHPELLTVAEAAAELHLSTRTIYSWVRAGALPAVRLGRSIRLRARDIERALRDGVRIPAA